MKFDNGNVPIGKEIRGNIWSTDLGYVSKAPYILESKSLTVKDLLGCEFQVEITFSSISRGVRHSSIWVNGVNEMVALVNKEMKSYH